VIATEKKTQSILIEDNTIEKVSNITRGIGVVYSGMGGDARVLVNKARKAAQKYRAIFNEYPQTSQLVQEVASVMQEFTQSGYSAIPAKAGWFGPLTHQPERPHPLSLPVSFTLCSGVRPFGVSLLIAGYDEDGPALYQVDPSGSYFAWKATAIGKNMVNGKTFLEKRYNSEMELDDAIHTAILTLKEGFEGQMTENNIEIGIIGGAEKATFRKLTAAEVKDYLANIG